MTEQNNAKLFGKIAAIMGEIRTLEKTGRNAYDKYDYVTSDAIATKIGAALAKHKVVLSPSMVSVETNEYTTQKGGSNFRTVVHMQMTLACGDTGATWSSLWSGEAIDRSDKSISKAAVSATKYFLLKTFLLAGGDEEDADASSPTVAASNDTPFDEPAKPRISKVQYEELVSLGEKFYNAEWAEQSEKLARAVSKGATDDVKDLLASEAATLIGGIKKKLVAANGEAVGR